MPVLAPRSWLFGLVAAFALCATALATPPAGDTIPEPVEFEHVDAMTRALALDDEQRDALEDLYAGYAEVVLEREEALDETIEQMEAAEGQYSDDWGALDERIERLEEEAAQLVVRDTIEFYDDARLLLNAEQAEQWDRWERHRRRLDELPKRVYAGDHLDLLAIVDEVEPDSAALERAAPALEAYELALDGALIRRFQARAHAIEQLERDRVRPEDIERITAEPRRASWGVAEVNRRHARAISDAFPPDLAAAILDRYARGAHPRLHYPRDADAAVNAALRMDLGPDQFDQVEAIRSRLDALHAEYLQRQIQATVSEERERALGAGDPDFPFAALGLEDPRFRRPHRLAERVVEIELERREKGTREIERLVRVLDEEQRKTLRDCQPANRTLRSLSNG